jgi:hypothetical protein
MKTLYFDIDGTILFNEKVGVKPALGKGRFEQAVRGAGFSQLVCVGSFATIAHMLSGLDPEYDSLAVLFTICRGAFQDESWLRSQTTLVADPANRVDYIDFDGDWWYVDDLAAHYMTLAGKADAFRANLGTRICVPEPMGEGVDILSWLEDEVCSPARSTR